jgi:hypothetical protein
MWPEWLGHPPSKLSKVQSASAAEASRHQHHRSEINMPIPSDASNHAVAKPDSKLEPSDEHERLRKLAVLNRYLSRAKPPECRIVGRSAGGDLMLGPKDGDDFGYTMRSLDLFGTASPAFANRCMTRLLFFSRDAPAGSLTEDDINASLASVSAIAPRDEVEAMLALQMIATQEAAMDAIGRAKLSTDPLSAERYSKLAMKLMRSFAAQLESLEKRRRGGEQKVTVEHVHVHAGGQAIVGTVKTGGKDGGGS